MRLPPGAWTGLRHADRWRVERMLKEQPELACEDEGRDLGLWLRLFEPDDLVRVGEAICEATATTPDEMCWGCTWQRDGVVKSVVAYCVSATELLRGLSRSEAMTRREACEAVIGRLRARNVPILLVVDDGEEGLEVWIDTAVGVPLESMLQGRCPGGRNPRTRRRHRVLWAYEGLWEDWDDDDWSDDCPAATPKQIIDLKIERSVGQTDRGYAR